MKIIFNTDWYHTIDNKIAIALGSFDGIHKGHKKLIETLNDIKEQNNCDTMIYTFKEHPMTITSPNAAPLRITDNQQKINILRQLNIDYLVFNEFTTDFSKVSPEDFVDRYLLDKYNIDTVVVGYNFKFGIEGKGDVETLIQFGREKNFDVRVIPPVKLNGEIISSSKIRILIEQGNIRKAANFLGYPYSLKGKVIRGDSRGRRLGFPTANLKYDKMKVIPKKGVYLTLTLVDDIFIWGLTNVGNNPTFAKKDMRVETHLLGYSGNLYGKEIELYFFDRIRDEIKFDNAEHLIIQMNKDVNTAKNYIYKIIQMCYNT